MDYVAKPCPQTDRVWNMPAGVCTCTSWSIEVRKRARIRKQYRQAPQLTEDTNGKVTTTQLDITNESQEISLFPAGDHKAPIIGRARKHNKKKTEIT